MYVSVRTQAGFLEVFCWISLITFPLAKVHETLCVLLCIPEQPGPVHLLVV